MSNEQIYIDSFLVRRLISAQFPQWADLSITPVEFGGCDNKTFHLGQDMTLRLPSSAEYAPQVQKEHRWLPILAPLLPLPIPTPLAIGTPTEEYPWHWSIYRWLNGETATLERITDLCHFATALAKFLLMLQQIDTSDAPMPGAHNFYRGGSLAIYDGEARQAITTLGNTIDKKIVTSIWNTALASSWQHAPVWVHGDIASGNLLVEKGQLSAIIDFGGLGIGDPACDLAIAWTFFEAKSRAAFRAALPFDFATWACGQGWALWKALITYAAPARHHKAIESRHIIEEIIADYNQCLS